MSDELSEMVRAAAYDEAAAAEREFQYSSATLGRFVGDVRRRRAVGGAMLAVAGVAVVGAAVLGLGRPWQAAPPVVTPSPSPTPSASSSPTPTPTVEPTPTPSPSSTPAPIETTPAPEPTTPPAGIAPAVAPGQVTVVDAGMGGGSGEIVVDWDTIADATGYRVYRSDVPDGPFVASATVDVATGETTVEFAGSYEFIQVWPPSPQSFQYIEASVSDPGYFRVTAFNAAGEGPPSVVVCGRPVGYPDC